MGLITLTPETPIPDAPNAPIEAELSGDYDPPLTPDEQRIVYGTYQEEK